MGSPRRRGAARALPALLVAAAAAAAALALARRSASAFTSAGLRTSGAPGAPRVARAATATATSEDVDVDAVEEEGRGLLPGERYIAMNRFMVRDGAEAKFEERWAKRKSSLLELPGFRWFSLMRRVPPAGAGPDFKYQDDYSYVSFTIWETKKNFNSWRKGPAFQEAHGGGDIFAFVGMIINGFMTSKGPPKPAFWRGLLLEKSAAERPRLVSGPGGRPEADGRSLLEPEVFVSMNRFSVVEGREREFEERWAKRESQLRGLPGFRYFQILRRDQTPDDDVNYVSMAVWDDLASFDAWRQGDAFKKAHGGGEKKPEAAAGAGAGGSSQGQGPMGGMLKRPPKLVLYEGKLVLESVPGA